MQSTQPPRKLFSISSLTDLGISNGQSPETIRSLELMNVQKSQAYNLRIPFSSALMTQLQKTTSSQTMMTSVLLKQTDGKPSGDWVMTGPKVQQHLMFTLAEKRTRLSSVPSTTIKVTVGHRQVVEEQTAQPIPFRMICGLLLYLQNVQYQDKEEKPIQIALKSISSAQTLIRGLRPTSTNTLKTKTS